MKALERLLEREGLPSFVNLLRTEGLQDRRATAKIAS